MTDLSGIGSNLTYTNGVPSNAPYYYISAHLDLTDVSLGNNLQLTYYFNKDNNLSYLESTVTPNYHNFHMVSSNAVIGDVVLYANSEIVLGSGAPQAGLQFEVGGSIYDPDFVQPEVANPVTAIWGGPTGYTKGAVTAADINTGVVCFYGHEGGQNLSTDDPAYGARRYLAVTIKNFQTPGDSAPGDDIISEPIVDDGPLPVNPIPVDPLPVDPLPVDPLPVDPLPVDGDEPVIIIEENNMDSARALKRRQDAVAAAVKHGRVVQSQNHEILNAFRSKKRSRRSVRTVVDPDIASGKLFVVVKVYPKVSS